MNSIDVVRKIITELQLESARFTIFEHFVAVNWRVLYPAVSQKLNNIKEGLIQHRPYREWKLSGQDILNADFDPSKITAIEHHVVSISSKITCHDGINRHIAMMNLHPEEGLTLDDIVMIVEGVTEDMPGYILESGRYYHFYGVSLLDKKEWTRFMVQFLMLTIIVSPRYIGHCLYRDYAALRLSTDTKYKTLLPRVCGFTGALRRQHIR